MSLVVEEHHGPLDLAKTELFEDALGLVDLGAEGGATVTVEIPR